MKIKITAICEINDTTCGPTQEEHEAFEQLVLQNEVERVILHSNFLGDEIGEIVAIESVEYLQ